MVILFVCLFLDFTDGNKVLFVPRGREGLVIWTHCMQKKGKEKCTTIHENQKIEILTQENSTEIIISITIFKMQTLSCALSLNPAFG